jgi:methylmalonyl-CoA mutase N-terminal domain/subunit
VFRVDERVEPEQVERLRAVRARRDAAAVDSALAALEAAARGDDNLVTPILVAVEAYASIGEICRTLVGVFGEHRDAVTL